MRSCAAPPPPDLRVIIADFWRVSLVTISVEKKSSFSSLLLSSLKLGDTKSTSLKYEPALEVSGGC